MKGISPMIATILLLAFTVAIGGILSIWFTGLTTTQTAGIENRTAGVVRCAGSLVIEEAKVTNSPVVLGNSTHNTSVSYINVTFWNAGQYGITNIKISILNVSTLTVYNTGSLTAGAMNSTSVNMTLCSNIYCTPEIKRIRVYGNCEGGPVSDDCDATEGCWVAV